MPKYIIDASVVLKWFVGENDEGFEPAREIFQKLKDGELVLFAPIFLLTEFANVIYWKQKFLSEDVDTVLGKLINSGINFADCPAKNIVDVFKLMVEYRLSAYDSLYLWLAKDRRLKLISCDKKLLAVKENVINPVELLG
jgi:predicted nucleic acid-binding protein